MKDRIKLAALALKAMLDEVDNVEAGNKVAAIRFRREIRKVNGLMIELRDLSKKVLPPTPSHNEADRMEHGDVPT
jgi:hypothetical protein